MPRILGRDAATASGDGMTNMFAVAGPNSTYQLAGAAPAGFLGGLWHGLISTLTFLVSLVSAGVRIYETNNNGRWYDFGFVLGVSAAFGGGGSRAAGSRAIG
jgi:hypothetical protein